MGAKIILFAPHLASTARAASGVSLLIAALSVRGTSTIRNTYQIDRSYERIEGRLNGIVAEIVREL